ncbi:MAG: hypothetical protein QXS51_03190 [Thermoproteota archaeon]|nr:hypothetical protein [Candidatus Brockarchaeota archaeon]MBO3840738.1 hypothetical protein [Candidatus Brockarchaeota archaeon]
MSLKQLTCANCNATITAPQVASIVVCPYCGHTFEISTGKKLEYYMFPAYVDSASAWRKTVQFILRRYGVPEDFNTEANLRKTELYNIPYHVFSCKAYSSCFYHGNQASYIEVRNISILAARTGTWLDGFAEKLYFSVRGRSFFNPNQAQKSRFYLPTLDYHRAYNMAYQFITSQAISEARKSCSGFKGVDKAEVNYLGLVHYPLWLMEYNYKGKTYRVLMDASGGKVIFVEYPLSTKSRTIMLTAATIMIIVGLVSGLLASFISPIGILSGLLSSIIISSPLLVKALSLKDKGSETPAQRRLSSEAWRAVEALTSITSFRLPVLE